MGAPKMTEAQKRAVACPACDAAKGQPCRNTRRCYRMAPGLDRAHPERRAAALAAPVTADALRAMEPAKRRAAYEALSPEAQEAVTVPCDGEAHGNAHIDHCMGCLSYRWGRMLAPRTDA